jgi:hypothetical protein
MSLEPIREDERVVETAATTREDPGTANESVMSETETGSAWWVELVFGSACCLAAATVALAHLSVGPLSRITMVYSTVPTVLYLVVATALGVGFLHSGLR